MVCNWWLVVFVVCHKVAEDVCCYNNYYFRDFSNYCSVMVMYISVCGHALWPCLDLPYLWKIHSTNFQLYYVGRFVTVNAYIILILHFVLRTKVDHLPHLQGKSEGEHSACDCLLLTSICFSWNPHREWSVPMTCVSYVADQSVERKS